MVTAVICKDRVRRRQIKPTFYRATGPGLCRVGRDCSRLKAWLITWLGGNTRPGMWHQPSPVLIWTQAGGTQTRHRHCGSFRWDVIVIVLENVPSSLALVPDHKICTPAPLCSKTLHTASKWWSIKQTVLNLSPILLCEWWTLHTVGCIGSHISQIVDKIF